MLLHSIFFYFYESNLPDQSKTIFRWALSVCAYIYRNSFSSQQISTWWSSFCNDMSDIFHTYTQTRWIYGFAIPAVRILLNMSSSCVMCELFFLSEYRIYVCLATIRDIRDYKTENIGSDNLEITISYSIVINLCKKWAAAYICTVR